MTPEHAYDWLAPKLSTDERKVLDVIYEAAAKKVWGWTVTGTRHVFFGEFAEQDARAEAKRIGGTKTHAFPLYCED